MSAVVSEFSLLDKFFAWLGVLSTGEAVGGDFIDPPGAVIGLAIHAVALDEKRDVFTPTLWDPGNPYVTQVRFPGGHADVGGGYAEHGLCRTSLCSG